jgi:hypothetical protein
MKRNNHPLSPDISRPDDTHLSRDFDIASFAVTAGRYRQKLQNTQWPKVTDKPYVHWLAGNRRLSEMLA